MVSLAEGASPRLRERIRSRGFIAALWVWYAVAGLCATAAYFLIDSAVLGAVVYAVVGASSVVAVVAGVYLNRPAVPRMWFAFAGGLLLFVIADAVFFLYDIVLDESPFPSVADGFYVAGYPLLAGGILFTLRGRGSRAARRGALLDAAIVAAGLTVPTWALLVAPIAHEEGLSLATRLLAIGYPAGDFLVLAVLVRLLFSPGRTSPAYALLVASVLALLAADVAYAMEAQMYVGRESRDAGWLLSYILWGAAALHPSMRTLAADSEALERTLERRRVVVLACALLTPPVTLLIQAATGRHIDAGPMLAATTGLALLVFGRMVMLLRERERLRMAARELFENATDIIARVDLSGRLIDVNRAAERSTGYPRAEVIGRHVSDILSDGDRRTVEEHVGRMLAGEVEYAVFEIELAANDGRRIPVEANSRLVREDGRVIGWEAFCRDLSERQLLEERLRQAQRMEAIGNLAGGIAHDFNNLLMAIRGYSELALTRLGDTDAAVREEIQGINQAASRASGLTEQLLAFSRKQALRPEIVDLNVLVLDMEALLSRVIGADVAFVTDLDPRAGAVKVDRAQLEQALVNLAVNARDAMPTGGKLTIETRRETLTEPQMKETGLLQPGRYAVVAVRDTGSGVEPSARPHVFDPFFTTKELGKGTGLGLSTVYGVVIQSGGQIEVESRPGAGAIFTIFLPAVAVIVREPTLAEPVEPKERTTGSENVLLVEDDDLVREVLRRVLEQDGYAVLEAANGHEALELAGNGREIDLLVTDLIMPGMTGYELARQLTQNRLGLKVLTITGYAGDNAALVEDPPYAVLQKPFPPDVFSCKVRELLDGPAPPPAA